MSDTKGQVIIPVELSDKQKEHLSALSVELDETLMDTFQLTNGEHLALLVLLCLRFIDRALEQSPEGEITVESLANSIQASIVRTWRKTAERRGQ